jgi:hypothetical protein
MSDGTASRELLGQALDNMALHLLQNIRLFSSSLPSLACEPERPAILAAKEGDLIEVIQPDGERETYRLASAEPSEDGISVTFKMEPVP